MTEWERISLMSSPLSSSTLILPIEWEGYRFFSCPLPLNHDRVGVKSLDIVSTLSCDFLELEVIFLFPACRPLREGMSPVGSPRRSEIFAESQKSPNPRTPAGFTPCCASRGTGHPLRAAGGTFPRVDTLPDLTPDRQETQQWTSRFCLKTGNAAKVNENQGSCRITSQNTAKVNESDNEFG